MGRNGWTLGILASALIAGAALFGWKVAGRPPPPLLHVHAVNTLLVRTDYSDPAAWAEVRDLVSRPTPEGFVADVDVIEDHVWSGLPPAEVRRRLYPDPRGRALMIVADARTMHDPEHTLLCVDPRTLESLRVIPSLLWSIENNLSLANLDWRDFADNTDKDGVLRSFKGPDGNDSRRAAALPTDVRDRSAGDDRAGWESGLAPPQTGVREGTSPPPPG